MRTIVIALILPFMFVPRSEAEAQRRYKVYKADEFGNRSVFSKPEAIIEQDPLSGNWEVYDSTPLGFPDTVRGPSYIIENDSLFSIRDNDRSFDGHDDENRYRHHHHDEEHCDGDDRVEEAE